MVLTLNHKHAIRLALSQNAEKIKAARIDQLKAMIDRMLKETKGFDLMSDINLYAMAYEFCISLINDKVYVEKAGRELSMLDIDQELILIRAEKAALWIYILHADRDDAEFKSSCDRYKELVANDDYLEKRKNIIAA